MQYTSNKNNGKNCKPQNNYRTTNVISTEKIDYKSFKINKSVIVSSYIISLLHCGTAVAALSASDFYVGIDAVKTHYSTQERFGSNIFAKNPNAYNIYGGYKFNDRFFVEVGYERTKNKGRTDKVVEGDYYPGGTNPVPNLMGGVQEFQLFSTKIKYEQKYCGFGVNFYPLNNTNTYFSTIFGLSLAKIEAEMNFLANENGAAIPQAIQDEYRTFKKSKVIPNIKVAINHNFTDNLAIRFNVSYHKLSNVKIIKAPQDNVAKLRFKHALSYGIGLKYLF